ncbi:hypothetical protein LEP3755_48340 [Leptolyngbya sp. NIES-3755]|nr:hypothetical protein LEP3755_48340 [Leptolyngbya sp. NIES-3755]
MTPSMNVGYQGAGFDSPAYKLTEIWGNALEQITSGDKLALIAVLAGWLSEDDESYSIPQAAEDCPLSCSEAFYLYISFLAEQERPLTPDDALCLIAALTAQLKGKVYAE